MKRLCLLLLCVVLLFCVGCTKQWSDEKGHIYRDDIEPSDFAFLFNEWDYEPSNTDEENSIEMYKAFKGDKIKLEDIYDSLGLPCGTTEFLGVINYSYLIGDEYDIITIKYDPSKGVVDLNPEIYSNKDAANAGKLFVFWSSGASTLDKEQYRMQMRFDISESELCLIDESTTSKELQKAFGAPHYYIELRKSNIENVRGNIFVYELENGDAFKIIYFRQGYILRAWVEDKEGNELDIFIDRDMESYYENKQ